MKRSTNNLKDKIYFWKTYNRQVKSVLNKFRMADINSFARRFKAGKIIMNVIYCIYLDSNNTNEYSQKV